MKRFSAVFMAVVLMLCCLSACGKKNDDASAEKTIRILFINIVSLYTFISSPFFILCTPSPLHIHVKCKYRKTEKILPDFIMKNDDNTQLNIINYLKTFLSDLFLLSRYYC